MIKPNLAIDYQPSGMWTGLLGADIPDNGDPEFAKKFIADSGEPMPELTLDYPKTEVNDKAAAAIVTALEKAGIKVTPNPIDPGGYYGIVMDPDKAGSLIMRRLGPGLAERLDGHPRAVHAERWLQPVAVATTRSSPRPPTRPSRSPTAPRRAQAWAELNKQAMAQVVVVPTRFGKQQGMVGSKMGGAFLWAPYGSWTYASMYVQQ